MGKVKYLIERLNISPRHILLLSFTKKSADDLAKKIKIKDIEINTFHKLGLNIIKEVEGTPSSIYEQNSQHFIKQEFKKLLKEKEYMNHAVKFFTDYLRIEKDDFLTSNHGEHIQHLKDQNFRPYKKKCISKNGKETYLREIVKSQEECQIANFLLFHGIKYNYEEKYEFNTKTKEYRQYAPDFSIYGLNNNKIYLEHYGIDENNNVPPFFANESKTLEQAKQEYNDSILWKRNLHKEKETICLETFSYQFKNKTIYQSLKEQLKEQGIEAKELSDIEKWNIINDSASDEVEGLSTLFNTFLNLYKSKNHTYKDLNKEIETLGNFEKTRTEIFLYLFRPIHIAYQKMLKKNELIDFNDMINKATSYIDNNSYLSNYKYIIVDEFQDISFGRYQLLKALKSQNINTKLFAVGDDWQSIYRFTGSDITLFNNFEKYFGFTNTSKIETTYRFGQPMIDVSGKFIMKNPSQIKKNLITKIDSNTYLQFYYNKNRDSNDTDILEDALNRTINNVILVSSLSFTEDSKEDSKEEAIYNKLRKETFFLLSRYNFDINRIKFKGSNFTLKEENLIHYKFDEKLTIKLNFLTVHRSKGLQADYVFILNCNSGKMGFPSEISDDPVLSLLLGNSEQFTNSEERRLFYVALSRAKKETICIINSNFTSKFINELDTEHNENEKCPRCKIGKLTTKKGVSRNNIPWEFKSCSNYMSYGCDYKKWK